MKPFKKKVYIRNGIIYYGDEAKDAKEESEAEKQVSRLRTWLENTAGQTTPLPTNEPAMASANNGEKEAPKLQVEGSFSMV